MRLADLDLLISQTALPCDVRSFLREAERRIDRFQLTCQIPGFVPSEFEFAYNVLQALASAAPTFGGLFCEWGSGFGVVACLAAMLDFDACGIEIEGNLVEAAEQLASDFDLPVKFVCGSFIPKSAQVCSEADNGFAWLATDKGNMEEELGLAVEDFGVIFAYPWPDEERLIDDLFVRYAAVGAVLVTHHGGQEFRLRRKRNDWSLVSFLQKRDATHLEHLEAP
jgi:hypothetical protein